MSSESALLAGRELAEAQMLDAGELRGPDTKGPQDPDTGKYPVVPGALKYAGKAKVQTADTMGNARGAAERLVMTTRFEVHLPMDAPAVAVDDVWTTLTSVHDPELVGVRFRVASLFHKSFATARRLTVEEVQN